MVNIRPILLLLALTLPATSPVSADVLLVESIQSAPDIPVPRHGLTMTQVRQQFGGPLSELAAVGDPPITRWEYNGFSVFFEHNLVLHSVIQRTASN